MGKKKNGKTPEVSVVSPVVDTPTPTPAPVGTAARFAMVHTALSAIRTAPVGTPDAVADAIRTAMAAVPNAPVPTHNRCRFTGFPVAIAQNALFVMNETDEWAFTDPVLAIAWAIMFPTNHATINGGGGFTSAVSKYIGGTRSLFNHHKHGGLPPDMAYRPAQGRSAKSQNPAPTPADGATVSIQEPVAA